MIKIIGIVVGIVIALLFFGYVFEIICYEGVFDKKYTREELVDNFNEHEKDFTDFINYFNSKLIDTEKYEITLGVSKRNSYTLILYPLVISPSNTILGGTNLDIDSPQLDTALKVLGWSKETVKNLKNKLQNTNCDWVRTTDIYGGHPIEMYPNQNGGSFISYLIFNTPVSEHLINIHGKPIRNKGFGSRVVFSRSIAGNIP